MKKSMLAGLIVLAAACVGLWWLWGTEESARPNPSARPDGKLRVVVSGYAAYALAREIGGDKVQLTMLVPPGTEPHHFEPTPGSVIAVNASDLFVYVSPRIEPWTADIIKGLGNMHTLEAGPSHAEDDPHVWMTPYGALSMAKRMEEAFSEIDPKNKSYYKANLKKFERETEALHSQFKQGLASCRSHDVVHVGHLAFASLAHAYGLELQSLAGTSHQGEHSVHRLAELVRFIRKNGVPVVFTEEMISADLADAVARETGVRVLPLYTVEEVGKQDFERGVTYADYMRRNLKNLREGLQCAQ